MNIKGIVTAKSITLGDYVLKLEPAEGGIQLSIIRGNEIQTELLPAGTSPSVDIEETEGGYNIRIVDVNGEKVHFLAYSALPQDGEAGQVLTRTEDGAQWADAPSGLPEGGAPYQQLVTDGDGVTVWEDRKIYDIPIENLVNASVVFDGTTAVVKYESLPGNNVEYIVLLRKGEAIYTTHMNGVVMSSYDIFELHYAGGEEFIQHIVFGPNSGNCTITTNGEISGEYEISIHDPNQNTVYRLHSKYLPDSVPVITSPAATGQLLQVKTVGMGNVDSINCAQIPLTWETVDKAAAAVADAAGDTPTAAEFNALLTSLRNAGYLATE